MDKSESKEENKMLVFSDNENIIEFIHKNVLKTNQNNNKFL